MYKQLYEILCYYLKETGVFFNKSRLRQLLASHPENNSMHAMTDVLEELHIENIAFRLDMDSLRSNGFPAIVHTGKGGGSFVVVDDIADDKVYYYNAKTGKAVESLEEFSFKWSGIALYVSQDEIQAELERKKTSSGERMLSWRAPLAIIAGIACAAVWSFAVAGIFNLFFISMRVWISR